LFLLPPSMADWLEEDHLAWFVIDAVALIDTSALHRGHPNDGPGRPPYQPEMMLALLLYAYATGMRSSRQIARACRYDLAFRVICANLVPDHTTIASFRADNEEAVKAIFVEVLKLCDAAGLATLGCIAIDGTKVGSDAALDKNRDIEWIRSEIDQIVAEAAGADAAEAEQAQLFDAEALPEALRRRGGRLARLKAALAEAEAQQQAAAARHAEQAAKANTEAEAGRKLRGRKPKGPHAAKARAEADLAAAKTKAQLHPERADLGEEVKRCEARLAEAAETAEQAEPAKVQVNVTDPDSRIMKTQQGWVQGYNVQASVNDKQVVIAYQATQDHNDVGQFSPMVQATHDSAKAAGIDEPIGMVLADAGYWSDGNATADGPERLIATTKDWKQRKAARDLGNTAGPPPPDASPIEAMEHRLRTAEGASDYATRSHTVEPVFADTKENRGFRRFMRRGLAAADAESALIFAVHNLLKIFHHNPDTVFAVA
jgi:transposase